MALAIGTKAPDFKAYNDDGHLTSLDEVKGKWTVLYFYPQDDTSGCTKEACSFRDHYGDITKSGASVIGVSPDSVNSHVKFKEKYNLNFMLLSDIDKTICNAYDVIGEKTSYGKTYIGLIRTTYILDDKGIIRHVFPNVKVDGHSDAVIKKLEELRNG